MNHDNVFGKPQRFVDQFSFNDTVANVFSDMISRSVPGYELTLEMLGVISRHYSQADTYCYDIGSSLGASTFALAKGAVNGCQIVGIDNSEAMHNRANALLLDTDFSNLSYLLADAQGVDYQTASVISSNFTLQFIPMKDRAALLNKIYQALVPDGVFVLSEKIDFENPKHSNTQIDLYHDFKLGRGYSQLEVAQKRTALENVLIPETLEAHKQRLLEIGFRDVMPWFQCFNFCSLIAFK